MDEQGKITRDFKGVWIPRDIWLNGELSALEKVILAEIDSLDSEQGCFASNQYLAEFCQCSITKVSLAISKLIKLGYIYNESFNGRQRVLKSSLSKSERQTFKKCKAPNRNNKKANKEFISDRESSFDTDDFFNAALRRTYGDK